jgi:hypothetical protein
MIENILFFSNGKQMTVLADDHFPFDLSTFFFFALFTFFNVTTTTIMVTHHAAAFDDF